MTRKFSDADLLRAIARQEKDVKIGPSTYRLADELGVTRQAVQRRIDRLRADGHVEESVMGVILSGSTRAKIGRIERILEKSEQQQDDEGYAAYTARIAQRRVTL